MKCVLGNVYVNSEMSPFLSTIMVYDCISECPCSLDMLN